ncbi:M48 family metalloprotease [Burkholderia ubonensis]|uniref:M48 family metalloprotease n=1 Tax=Burkholderia ubonensis TaxID=101571 RepID=UPI000A8ADA3E|nr:M48 family metalloprotease [Burkholderia ubonensis]
MSNLANKGFRLNPFPFPSDTTLRFIILFTLLISSCGSLYADFWSSINSQGTWRAEECNLQAIAEITRFARTEFTLQQMTQKTAPLLANCSRFVRPRGECGLGGILLTLVITAVVYLLFPAWKIKATRLHGIAISEQPELHQELHDLCVKADLPIIPVFVWNPFSAEMPVAFGRKGHYYVALSGASVLRFYSDAPAFRVIVLHELAHLRNGDIDKAYLTVAAWIGFLVAGLAPAIIITFATYLKDRVHAELLLLNAVFFAILIVLSGLSVLRARECYADIRASNWDGTVVNIDRVLGAMHQMAGGIFLKYLRFHPQPDERRRAVEDPSKVFPLSMGVALGLGLAAWLTESALFTLGYPFLPNDPSEFLIFIFTLAIIFQTILLLFAIGAISIGVWRTTFASLAMNKKVSSEAGRLSLAIGISYLTYVIITYLQVFLSAGNSGLNVVFIYLELQLVVSIVLMAGCFLIFRWVASAASAWFEVVVVSRSPRVILGLTVVATLLAVAGTLFGTMFITMWLFSTSFRQGYFEPLVLVGGSMAFVGSIAAWAFPLAAVGWCKRKMPTTFPDWAFLDNHRPKLPYRKPIRVGRSLMIGVGTGLAGCLFWAMHFNHYLPARLANWVSWLHPIAQTAGDALYLPAPTAVFQVVAAAITAACVERLNIVCGLFAATVSGTIASIGLFVLIRGEAISLLWMTLAATSLGALITLPATVMAAWLQRLCVRYRLIR